MLKYLMASILLLVTACDNNDGADLLDDENNSWVFVANEGNYGSTTGSISMINEFGDILETDYIGDVVQSLEVYQNKLIVLINNSHVIKVFDIHSENGISMPGIEISTGQSSPRDLVVVNDKVYFTNWNTQDVKVLNLFTYDIEDSIPVNGLPEDILLEGNYLWVTIPHSDLYFSTGNKVIKIDIQSNSIVEEVIVENGPQELALFDNEIYVSTTYYDEDWNAVHGTAKISDLESVENIYGSGVVCGGSVLSFNNKVYRSADGGIISLNANLDLNESDKIGAYDQSLIYHVEVINNQIWFALTNSEIRVVDFYGDEITSYQAGIFPGDFAYWHK